MADPDVDDVSDFIIVRQSDMDDARFLIKWACRDNYRQQRPVRVTPTLTEDNSHLIVTINDVIYYNEDLPGKATKVEEDIKHSSKVDHVFITVHKREPGRWARD